MGQGSFTQAVADAIQSKRARELAFEGSTTLITGLQIIGGGLIGLTIAGVALASGPVTAVAVGVGALLGMTGGAAYYGFENAGGSLQNKLQEAAVAVATKFELITLQLSPSIAAEIERRENAKYGCPVTAGNASTVGAQNLGAAFQGTAPAAAPTKPKISNGADLTM